MFKSSLYLSVMLFYVNALGYILHMFIARELGPEKYGEFMVVYSFMLSVGFLSSVYPSITIKTVIDRDKIRYDILRFIRTISVITGLFMMMMAFVLSKYIAGFLRVSQTYIILAGLVWLFVFISSVEKGFLQAKEKFGLYSAVNSTELTVRFLLALVLVYAGYGTGGVIASSFLSLAFITLLLYIINGNIKGNISKINFREIGSLVLTALPSGVLIYADDIFIKRVFDPNTAGLYASASIVGKAFIWFCTTIFSVFFVKMIKDISNYKIILAKYTAFVIAAVILAEISVMLSGQTAFSVLFGQEFRQAAQFLEIYLPVTVPLIMSVAVFMANIGIQKLTKIIYIHLFVYCAGFVFLSLKTPHQYLLYVFTVNSLFVLFYVYALFLRMKKL